MKSEYKNTPLNLENLIQTLECLFQKLNVFDCLKNATVVIPLGSTGCGKSTLLNSLLFGSKSL